MERTLARSLGIEIRTRRTFLKITLREMSELCGIEIVSFGEIERDVRLPSQEELAQILRVVGDGSPEEMSAFSARYFPAH